MASLRGFLFGGIIGGAGGVFIGFLLATALFLGGGFLLSGGSNIPYSTKHWEIAHAITVMDTSANIAMNVKHLATMEARYSPAIVYYPAVTNLERNTTYTQSIWYFSLGDSNDVEVTMVIVGPAKDGKTYFADFGSHLGHNALISGYGQTLTWTENSQRTGLFTIELP